MELGYATIDGELSCVGSQFFGGGEASGLSAFRAKIHGDAIFDKDFKAEGGLYLLRATIGGHPHCGQSHFISKAKPPLWTPAMPKTAARGSQFGDGSIVRRGGIPTHQNSILAFDDVSAIMQG